MESNTMRYENEMKIECLNDLNMNIQVHIVVDDIVDSDYDDGDGEEKNQASC